MTAYRITLVRTPEQTDGERAEDTTQEVATR